MALGRHAQDAGGAYGVVSLRTPEVSSSLEPLHQVTVGMFVGVARGTRRRPVQPGTHSPFAAAEASQRT